MLLALLAPPKPIGSALTAAGFGLWLALSPLSSDFAQKDDVPILEVIKVYGKIAGPTCFGKTAPKGSSCQVTRQDFEKVLASASNGGLSKEQFRVNLESLEFEWPLKPYGVEKSESKTATMNKGAETRLYMEQLEARGLFDRRNPTGPLPTSVRPNLNRLLQQEGVGQSTADLVFNRLAGKYQDITSPDALFQGKQAIDYYDFLDFLGKNSITWN